VTVDVLRSPSAPAVGTLARLHECVQDLYGGRRERRQRTEDAAIDRWIEQRERIGLKLRWSQACARARLGEPLSNLGGFRQVHLPRIVDVRPGSYGHAASLMLAVTPGTTVEELEQVGPELAAGLGVWRLRFTPRGGDFIRCDLITHDPLSQSVPFPLPCPSGNVAFGVDEFGDVVSTAVEDLTHIICQGQTRSGKSWWTYSLLAQLAGRDDVDVCGIDPTGLVLRPFPAHPRGWRVSGVNDAARRYEAALAGLVDDMDNRIRRMPAHRDTVPITPDTPLRIVIGEEWPGVGRMLGHSRSKPSPVHRLMGRLLSEGAKAGYRVLLLAQRADADSIGAFERDQCATRISFRSSDPNTIKFLHEAPADVAELHTAAPAGIGLLSAPAVPLLRFRGPAIGGYSQFVSAVSGADGLAAVAA
jgi:S-DNA-T family DNA segregation ATPase FtsK/SpoIIIE